MSQKPASSLEAGNEPSSECLKSFAALQPKALGFPGRIAGCCGLEGVFVRVMVLKFSLRRTPEKPENAHQKCRDWKQGNTLKIFTEMSQRHYDIYELDI